MNTCGHIKAKGAPENTSLYDHLYHVASVIETFAGHLIFDPEIAKSGAFLHDIGKASPVFQKRLVSRPKPYEASFRHEIASCFFLSLTEEQYHCSNH